MDWLSHRPLWLSTCCNGNFFPALAFSPLFSELSLLNAFFYRHYRQFLVYIAANYSVCLYRIATTFSALKRKVPRIVNLWFMIYSFAVLSLSFFSAHLKYYLVALHSQNIDLRASQSLNSLGGMKRLFDSCSENYVLWNGIREKIMNDALVCSFLVLVIIFRNRYFWLLLEPSSYFGEMYLSIRTETQLRYFQVKYASS